MLIATDRPLTEAYDLGMFDLDGVVYIGQDAVPGAPRHIAAARSGGLRCAFVTNNASRAPADVADHLRELGVEATTSDVVTSAQAAAQILVERLGGGGRVVMLGGRGLDVALRDVGLDPVGVEDRAEAVATGYGPDVRWHDIMRVAVRVRDGLSWVACNADLTIPTTFGVAPGHGVLVDTLRRFTGVEPVVAGKPSRPLLDETVRRVGGRRPLMIGDRLDTDIVGARNAEVDSLLVMTGVTGLSELVAARADERPTYLGADLGALAVANPAPKRDEETWSCGGWSARVAQGRLQLDGSGSVDDWWRVVAASAWAHLDASNAVVDTSGLQVPATS